MLLDHDLVEVTLAVVWEVLKRLLPRVIMAVYILPLQRLRVLL